MGLCGRPYSRQDLPGAQGVPHAVGRGAAAAGALTDFKNAFSTSNPAVAASTALVKGQTSVSGDDDTKTVTIETCFDEIGSPAACTTGDNTSTMKNTVIIE